MLCPPDVSVKAAGPFDTAQDEWHGEERRWKGERRRVEASTE
jgi:hypothetical protein